MARSKGKPMPKTRVQPPRGAARKTTAAEGDAALEEAQKKAAYTEATVKKTARGEDTTVEDAEDAALEAKANLVKAAKEKKKQEAVAAKKSGEQKRRAPEETEVPAPKRRQGKGKVVLSAETVDEDEVDDGDDASAVSKKRDRSASTTTSPSKTSSSEPKRAKFAASIISGPSSSSAVDTGGSPKSALQPAKNPTAEPRLPRAKAPEPAPLPPRDWGVIHPKSADERGIVLFSSKDTYPDGPFSALSNIYRAEYQDNDLIPGTTWHNIEQAMVFAEAKTWGGFAKMQTTGKFKGTNSHHLAWLLWQGDDWYAMALAKHDFMEEVKKEQPESTWFDRVKRAWNTICHDRMLEELLYCKFTQNTYCKKVLMNTGDYQLLHTTSLGSDSPLGIGLSAPLAMKQPQLLGNARGKNWLGKKLEAVRARIAEQDPSWPKKFNARALKVEPAPAVVPDDKYHPTPSFPTYPARLIVTETSEDMDESDLAEVPQPEAAEGDGDAASENTSLSGVDSMLGPSVFSERTSAASIGQSMGKLAIKEKQPARVEAEGSSTASRDGKASPKPYIKDEPDTPKSKEVHHVDLTEDDDSDEDW